MSVPPAPSDDEVIVFPGGFIMLPPDPNPLPLPELPSEDPAPPQPPTDVEPA